MPRRNLRTVLVVVPSLLWPKEEQIAVLANTQSTLPIIRYRRRGGRIWASYERRGGNKVRGRAACLLDYTSVGLCCFVSKCGRNLLTWHIRHPTVASVMEHFLASPPPRGSFVMVAKAREAIPLFLWGSSSSNMDFCCQGMTKCAAVFTITKAPKTATRHLGAIIAPYYR